MVSGLPQHFSQGSYRSWKTWKVKEFKCFSFQAWKVVGFNNVGHGKSWEIIVCVLCKFLQVPKQRQHKIQLCQKIPENKDDFYNNCRILASSLANFYCQ